MLFLFGSLKKDAQRIAPSPLDNRVNDASPNCARHHEMSQRKSEEKRDKLTMPPQTAIAQNDAFDCPNTKGREPIGTMLTESAA